MTYLEKKGYTIDGRGVHSFFVKGEHGAVEVRYSKIRFDCVIYRVAIHSKLPRPEIPELSFSEFSEFTDGECYTEWSKTLFEENVMPHIHVDPTSPTAPDFDNWRVCIDYALGVYKETWPQKESNKQ